MHLPQRIVAIVAAVLVAVPVVAAPARAAPASNPARLDDEVVRRLQSTPSGQRIPVIVEGASDPFDSTSQGSGERRAKRVESKIRGNGGHVVSTSNLLGATAAELTPDQIRSLLQQRPNLSPDEVKALLTGSARPLAGVARAAQGAGSLDIERTLDARTPRVARQHVVPSTALMRALLPSLRPILRGSHVGANEVMWDTVMWDTVMWDTVMWDTVLWD